MARDISRRNFLKVLGGGAVASSALLAACKEDKKTTVKRQEPAKGKMTYRLILTTTTAFRCSVTA